MQRLARQLHGALAQGAHGRDGRVDGGRSLQRGATGSSTAITASQRDQYPSGLTLLGDAFAAEAVSRGCRSAPTLGRPRLVRSKEQRVPAGFGIACDNMEW